MGMTIDAVLERLSHFAPAGGLISEPVLRQIHSVRDFLRRFKETFNLPEDPIECAYAECPSRDPAGIFKLWLKTKTRLLSLSTNGPCENDLQALHLTAIRLASVTEVEVVQSREMDPAAVTLHLVDGEQVRIAAGVIPADGTRDLRDLAVALQRLQ
jgi:hypothetical protein